MFEILCVWIFQESEKYFYVFHQWEIFMQSREAIVIAFYLFYFILFFYC